MSYAAFQALVKRDLRLYFQDRRAVTMSFVALIRLDRGFFGYLFGGASTDREASKIVVAAVDQDGSAISKRVVAGLGADKALDVKARGLEEAREAVRGGKTTPVAAVIPKGFGDDAARALFRSENKPEIQLLYDPSHGPELQMVRGILTQHVMEAVSAEAMKAVRVPVSIWTNHGATWSTRAESARATGKRCSGCWTAAARWTQRKQPSRCRTGRRACLGCSAWRMAKRRGGDGAQGRGRTTAWRTRLRGCACSSSSSWESTPAWWCCSSGGRGYGSGCRRRRSRDGRLSGAGRRARRLWRC